YAHAHSTVYMYAIYLHVYTTIGFTLPAGDAIATVKVRLYRYQFPHLKAMPRRNIQHFSGELVAEYARIVKIGLYAREGMQVRATDTDLTDLQQCFGGAGVRLICLDEL